MKEISCPYCNTDTLDRDEDENGKRVPGKRWCWECWALVKPVKAGTGKTFRRSLEQYKKQQAIAAAYSNKINEVKDGTND